MDKRELLQPLTFGARIAEEETSHLASYFVETDQWTRIYAGDVDVVYGAKGSGKSALYSLLLDKQTALFDRKIIVVPAENPRGAPAFKDLLSDPPTSEPEFTFLWKLYLLSLLGNVLKEYGIQNDESQAVQDELAKAGLLPNGSSLRQMIRAALDYARQLIRLESVEGGLAVDPSTGLPTGVTGKITFREPKEALRKLGYSSADSLLETANKALRSYGYSVWILLDRLDVAFAESTELEQNALRALFKAYLDLLPHENLSVKIFLRSDIWARITRVGFREASHITRHATITWNSQSLLNLIIRRALGNRGVLDFYSVKPDEVLANAKSQDELFYRMFPKQIDPGEKKPVTFDWLLGRTKDGTGINAPREIIHMLNATRNAQLKILERGGEQPPGEFIFSAQAFKDALPEVSEVRLFQTLTAEYPEIRAWLMALKGEKTLQTAATLATIWKTDENDAVQRAVLLTEVGFFEPRGTKESPLYWVPFLYRDALNMVQGAAD